MTARRVIPLQRVNSGTQTVVSVKRGGRIAVQPYLPVSFRVSNCS